MSHDDRREVLERLAALERRLGGGLDESHDGCEHRDHRHGRDHGRRGGGDFDEKRIIDTIVDLVSERVVRILEDQQARQGASDDGGGEKRIVDLIVGLVGEHVREIVGEELDRRLGRPPLAPPGPPPPGPPNGDAPRN
ncbi:MAG: hypothetical protein ACRERC_08855 [Candidatus Binatia bacterium]